VEPLVTAAVLGAALLHAAWNTFTKSSADKLVATTLITSASGLIGLAIAAALPFPAPASWPYLVASVVIHTAYFALTAAAYQAGEMSLVYPVMRGTAPLLTAVVSLAFAIEISRGEFVGVVLLSVGIAALALEAVRRGGSNPRALGLALANAAVISAYTLADGYGARQSGQPVAYAMWLFFFSAIPLAVWVGMRRGSALMAVLRTDWLRALGGGACIAGAYGIVLWAMTQAPIALVAALRETSVVFGLVLASLLLGERFGALRIAACVLVAAGAAVIQIA
jgi:drug/metabolite transporter (DMT)-like permease